MTTTISSSDIVVSVEPLFSPAEQLALAGFLAGYSSLTRDAYALDLPMYTAWCQQHALHLFQARRADIECFGRDMETRGRARATIARRLCTISGFYRYAVERNCSIGLAIGDAKRPCVEPPQIAPVGRHVLWLDPSGCCYGIFRPLFTDRADAGLIVLDHVFARQPTNPKRRLTLSAGDQNNSADDEASQNLTISGRRLRYA